MSDDCPMCGVSLQGEPIPDEYRTDGTGVIPADAPTHYSRGIGVEISGVYDGVLYYQCPDCGGRWHRFKAPHPLHVRAIPYVRGTGQVDGDN